MKPTVNQLTAIKNIEDVLQIKFEGNTKKEAWLWMQENKPKADKIKKSKSPSEKQLIAIKNIEKILDIEFKGTSHHEAWIWTKNHMPIAVEFIAQKIFNDNWNVNDVVVTEVNHHLMHSDTDKLRFIETIENLSTTPDKQELDKQITLLLMGLDRF